MLHRTRPWTLRSNIGFKQSWVYSGVAHIQFRVYSGVEYSHVYSTQLSRIYECILNTLYWVDTHTLYSAELNASALLYSAELSRTECLSMSIPIYSLQDCLLIIVMVDLRPRRMFLKQKSRVLMCLSTYPKGTTFWCSSDRQFFFANAVAVYWC